jgi:hypothetical protein
VENIVNRKEVKILNFVSKTKIGLEKGKSPREYSPGPKSLTS